MFNDAIRLAWATKSAPSNDIIDDVLEAVAYFEGKEKQQQKEQLQNDVVVAKPMLGEFRLNDTKPLP